MRIVLSQVFAGLLAYCWVRWFLDYSKGHEVCYERWIDAMGGGFCQSSREGMLFQRSNRNTRRRENKPHS